MDVDIPADLKDLTKCITDLSIASCMFHGCSNVLLTLLQFLMRFEPHFPVVIGLQRVSIDFLE